jgi:tryptophan-rich sensory protein
LRTISIITRGAFMPAWISPNLVALLVFVGLVMATATLGGQWGAGAWYANLSKPAWTPPGWLFPPVWLALYVMIAVAGWLIWKTPHESRMLILAPWAAQLVLNAAWSYIFFGRHEIAIGLLDILAMWVMIAAFIIAAWPVNRGAALLFIPYLIWVSYAAALNAAIWFRNTPAA